MCNSGINKKLTSYFLTLRPINKSTMPEFPPCPQCKSTYTYEMDTLLLCPECGHEWNPEESNAAEDSFVVKDCIESAKLKDSLAVNRNYRIVDHDGNNYKRQQIPGPNVIAEPFNLNPPFCNEFEQNFPKWKDSTVETFKK